MRENNAKALVTILGSTARRINILYDMTWVADYFYWSFQRLKRQVRNSRTFNDREWGAEIFKDFQVLENVFSRRGSLLRSQNNIIIRQCKSVSALLKCPPPKSNFPNLCNCPRLHVVLLFAKLLLQKSLFWSGKTSCDLIYNQAREDNRFITGLVSQSSLDWDSSSKTVRQSCYWCQPIIEPIALHCLVMDQVMASTLNSSEANRKVNVQWKNVVIKRNENMFGMNAKNYQLTHWLPGVPHWRVIKIVWR